MGRVSAGGPAVRQTLPPRCVARGVSTSTPGPNDATVAMDEKKGATATATAKGPEPWSDRIVKGIGYVTGFYSRSQVTLRSARTVYLSACEHAADPAFNKVRPCIAHPH
jgi:hypothetical protein